MPYSSGTYSFPSNSWNPAVANTRIVSADWNSTRTDLATALSTCLLKDGTQTATSRIPFASGVQTDSITEVTSTNGVSIAKVNANIGADIASPAGGTLNLTTATGQTVTVTGTNAITAITLAEGNMRWVRFSGALTLTHGASLVLPTAANITTGAGDYALFIGYASSVVRCAYYQLATGGSLAGGVGWSDKTASFNAAKSTAYTVDTATAAATVTATLPASPGYGDIIQFVDAAGSFATYNLVLGRNSLKIMGIAEDMTVSSNNAAFGIVYQGATNGWRVF